VGRRAEGAYVSAAQLLNLGVHLVSFLAILLEQLTRCLVQPCSRRRRPALLVGGRSLRASLWQPHCTCRVNINVNVEFKVTLHERVRYGGTLQYKKLQFVTQLDTMVKSTTTETCSAVLRARRNSRTVKLSVHVTLPGAELGMFSMFC